METKLCLIIVNKGFKSITFRVPDWKGTIPDITLAGWEVFEEYIGNDHSNNANNSRDDSRMNDYNEMKNMIQAFDAQNWRTTQETSRLLVYPIK